MTVAEVDAALTAIGAIPGSGSGAARAAAVQALFGRLTAAEQDYLRALVTGQVRQGALDGVMLAAIAAAAELPEADVRRAVMLAGMRGRWPRRPWPAERGAGRDPARGRSAAAADARRVGARRRRRVGAGG